MHTVEELRAMTFDEIDELTPDEIVAMKSDEIDVLIRRLLEQMRSLADVI